MVGLFLFPNDIKSANMYRYISYSIFIVVLTLIFTSCKTNIKEYHTLIIQHQAPSVSPEYQRNFKITLHKNGKGVISVDSYKDTLGQVNVTFSTDTLDNWIKSFSETSNNGLSYKRDCDGCRYTKVKIINDNTVVKSFEWTHLQKTATIGHTLRKIKTYFPQLDSLIKIKN